jgi:uncharacterized protein (DUF433 family)
MSACHELEIDMVFTRITVDPNKMGGVPCIRGLRIPVATVVGMVADGMTDAEILEAYPDLVVEDIREALRYAGGSCLQLSPQSRHLRPKTRKSVTRRRQS